MERSAVSLHDDVRDVAWRFLVGAGVGAIVGFAVGGLGGRLVMLVLRLASNDVVLGVDSDDGFEIGRVSVETGFLLMVGAGLGGVTGVAYVVLRSTLPRRGRAIVWGALAALVLGADVVRTDGIDFRLLEPKVFAVLSFVILPGVAAFTISVLVERLLASEPWSSRSLAVVLGLASLVLTVVLLAIAAVATAALLLRRQPALGRAVGVLGRVAVPIVLAVVAARSGLELWRDANAIL